MDGQRSTTGSGNQRQALFDTRHALTPDTRTRIVGLLNERLGDTLVLYTQTKQAHWNVKGPDFYQLHLLFDELAETIEEHADTIAERVTALGGAAKGTVHHAARGATIAELEENAYDGMTFVTQLADRYAQHARQLGENIAIAEDLEDKGTADMLTDLVRDVDKALYFLEAHLQRAGGR